MQTLKNAKNEVSSVSLAPAQSLLSNKSLQRKNCVLSIWPD